jgi:hypothetical protein
MICKSILAGESLATNLLILLFISFLVFDTILFYQICKIVRKNHHEKIKYKITIYGLKKKKTKTKNKTKQKGRMLGWC